MPPKRTLAEIGPTPSSSAPKEKRSRKAANDKADGKDKSKNSGKKDEELKPLEYYCIQRPYEDFAHQKRDEEELDEEEIEDKYDTELKKFGKSILLKPAAEHPDHEWIAMEATWKMYADFSRRATYTDPDLFEMYIYNDFHGYGLQELVENLLLAFDLIFKRSTRDENDVKRLWATAAAAVYWISTDAIEPWTMIDDSVRYNSTLALIARMYLTALHEVDRAGFLKADSPILDLPLVMSLFAAWASDLEHDGDEDVADLASLVIAYAKKAGVDLEARGCYAMASLVKKMGDEYTEIQPLGDDATLDRWQWTAKLEQFKEEYGPIGGERYNILKMSRKERAEHSFDGKDPLAQFSVKDLREGNIMLA